MSRRKRLTILTANFAPEANAAARRLSAAAEHFATAGWEITVITLSPHHPENRVKEPFVGLWRSVAREGNLRVIRFAPLLVPPQQLGLRLISELVFSIKAGAQALITRPDVILATSPYMFLGPIGLLCARLSRVPFAWDIRDLTWKYVKATGRRTYGLDAFLERLMKLTARKADVLTTATAGQLVDMGEEESKGRAVITNGLTSDFVAEVRKGNEPLRSDHRFTVVYAGLLGFPQGLSMLLDTAELLPDVRFVIAGDGPEGKHLKSRAREIGLKNVEFPGFIGLPELQALYASADVLVGMLRDSEEFRVAQPSKVWEYMATGKPVIFAGDCETTKLMTTHDLGVVVPPENKEALATAITRLKEDAAERARLGERGYTFVVTERNRDKILGNWESLLARIV